MLGFAGFLKLRVINIIYSFFEFLSIAITVIQLPKVTRSVFLNLLIPSIPYCYAYVHILNQLIEKYLKLN